ncbi:hypothetical protein BS47DRAFT_1369349 [Hydnum rufescens UP504]|uniref:Uncharacterized protein n=1 Tax=Hydnum rufescens UP504 TaxID=1448309 RepID=A0A9P6AEY7_9AGAM|nr:hypothetical protein BS47DRAFT_1369349 [Hydnum rufescens UP504]
MSRITDRSYEPSITHVQNVSGRVYGISGGLFQSVYTSTSGWAANWARGVLASTMYDAYSVPDVVAADAQVKTLLDLDDTGMPSFLREASIQPGMRIGHYQQWKIIDKVKGAGRKGDACVGMMYMNSVGCMLAMSSLTLGPNPS